MATGGYVMSAFQLHECVAVTIPGASDAEGPVVVWPHPIIVEGARFFLLRKNQDWICRFATGKGSWQRPLAPYALVETVREAWAAALVAGVGMAVNSKRKRAHRSTRDVVRGCGDKLLTISLPRSPGSTECVEVRAVRRGREMYLELAPSALTWLYEWCAANNHPTRDVVRHCGDEHEVSSRRGVFFSRAHGAWFARCKTASKRFTVRSVDGLGVTLPAETYRALLTARRADAEEWLSLQTTFRRRSETSLSGTSSMECASISSGSDVALAPPRTSVTRVSAVHDSDVVLSAGEVSELAVSEVDGDEVLSGAESDAHCADLSVVGDSMVWQESADVEDPF